jgi:ATP-dependent Clp protease ATP-binding subunit ClpC
MMDIINIMLKELTGRIEKQAGIILSVQPAVKKDIIEKHYDKKYGARPIRRALIEVIEDKLAEEILDGSVKRGDTVKVSLGGDKIKFIVKK